MRIAVAIVVFLLCAGQALAERRVALVIGNMNYAKLTPLNNPVIDARRMAALLAANGFEVVSCDGVTPGCFDLDREAMTDALEGFEDKTRGADLAFVFYAGHGMQTADGNVLAPVNMELTCDTLDPKRAILLDNVMDSLTDAREKIVVLDACRNDPFQAQQCAQRGGRPLSFDSVAVPSSGENFLILTSTKPGQVAQDGLPGAHSPFAEVLFKVMEEGPGISFDQMFNRAVKLVIEKTTQAKFTQVPEMLIRGGAPEGCLRGKDCSRDPQAEALRLEVESLKAENERGQEYEEIVTSLLRSAGYESLDAIPADQRDSFFTGIVSASRALAERNDSAGERALAALKAGDESAAEKLFEEEIAAREAGAEEERLKSAESYRHLAALARPKDIAKAAAYFAKAAERDPTDIQTWMDLAATSRDSGDTTTALAAYREASTLARDSGSDSQRIWAALGQGDIVKAQGRLQRALDFYTAAKNLAEDRVKEVADPETKRDLSVAHTKIGDVLSAQGKRDAALDAYKASLAIAEELAAADPGNSNFQRNLYAALWYVADAEIARSEIAAGSAKLDRCREIMQRLSDSDPSVVEWQRDVSVIDERIGDVRKANGDLDGALAEYRKSLTRMAPIRDRDPSNTDLQRFTSVTHTLIGNALYAKRELDAALAEHRASFDLIAKLAAADPANAEWQRELSVSHNKIGDILADKGDAAGAAAAYVASLRIVEKLAADEPANAVWQWDLFASYWRVGNNSNRPVEYFEKALTLLESLNADGRLSPEQAEWIAWTRQRLAEFRGGGQDKLQK